MIAVTSPGRGHGAVGIDLERRAQIVGAEPDVVRLHPAEVPELAAHFVETVGRGALEEEVDRGVVVGQPQLVASRRRPCRR